LVGVPRDFDELMSVRAETEHPDSDGAPSGRDDVVDLYRQLHGLLDRIDAVDTTGNTSAEVVEVAGEHERAVRRMAWSGHRRVMDVSDRDAFRLVGDTSVHSFLTTRLRVTQPRKRIAEMAAVARHFSVYGELLQPKRPYLAEAVAQGAVGADHVHAVLDTLDKIPAAIPADVVEAAERDMVDYAREFTPKEITALGTRVLAHLDPDGTLTDDSDRARRRGVSLGRQDSQLMSKLSGQLDPLTRAMFDTVLTAWAVKGMNNPADETPLQGSKDDVSAEELAAAAERDDRCPAQRNHDAFRALLRAALDGKLLGSSVNGLPPHVIVKITDAELAERAGFGRTATGTDLPIEDVIALAAEAQLHLAVFSEVTGQPLYLGTAQRLASRSQRFLLFAHHDGCACPGCSVPAAKVQIHHADKDWADGGVTDIDTLGPACGPHNRVVGPEPGQYTTHVVKEGPDAGRTAWTLNPQPGAPPNPARINRVHDVPQQVTALVRRKHRLRPPGRDDTTTPPIDIRENQRQRRLVTAGWSVRRVRFPVE